MDRFLNWTLLLFVLLTLALGWYVQSQVLLNHDVGYVVHSAGWLLQGKRFGHEIIEPNPPLIYWLSMPGALLHQWGWTTEAEGIRIVTFGIGALGVLLLWRVLQLMRSRGRAIEAHSLVAAAALIVFLLPGRAFGQREHLTLALSLPYLFMVGVRLEYGSRFSPSLAGAVGLLAAVGFALKPYFLAVPLLVELYHLGRTRSLARSFRPETWAMLVFTLAYAGSIPLLAPDYLRISVPLARPIYWAYEELNFYQMADLLDLAREPLLVVAVLILATRSMSPRLLVATAATLGYAVSYFAQFKGYDYHRLPVVSGAYLMLALACGDFLQWWRERAGSRLFPVAGIAVGTSLLWVLLAQDAVDFTRWWWDSYNNASGEIAEPRLKLIARIRELTHAGEYIYSFSTHPFPGFPTTNYIDAEWGGSMHSQWIMPGYIKRDQIKDPVLLKQIDEAEDAQCAIVHADLKAHPPTVILLEGSFRRHAIGFRRFDVIEYFRHKDPWFAEFWRHYREIETIGSIRVFLRKDAINPS